jgi:hypothetical protein
VTISIPSNARIPSSLRIALAWLLLMITISVGIGRARETHGTVLLNKPTRLCWITGKSLKDFAQVGAGALGVMPSRSGRPGERWTILDVLATGSRSALPKTAPRLELQKVATVPEPIPGERIVLIALNEIKPSEGLQPVLLLGDDVPRGLLASPSTRYLPGLIPATDLAATALGQPFGAGRQAVVVFGDLNDLEAAVTRWEGKPGLPGLALLLAAILVLARWRCWPRLALFAMGLPLGLFIAPLFLPGNAALLLALAFGGLAAWRLSGQAISVGILTVLALDLLLGGPVITRTPLSYSMTEATRFYGIGNETAGIFIGAVLLCTKRLRLSLAAPILLSLTMLIGLPTLGANVGCAVAALVGLAVRCCTALPKKQRLLGVLIAALLIFSGLGALAYWDASRAAAQQSHLGKAVSGGRVGMVQTGMRKLAMNGHLLLTSPWSVLLIAQMLALLLRRRQQDMDLTMISAAVAALIANDSGVMAAATLLLPAASDSVPAASEKSDTAGESD